MSRAVRIVGLGQEAAGDDGVGLEVARRLRAEGLEVALARDAADLVSLLETDAEVIVLDAVAGGGPPGTVLRLDEAALDQGPRPVSSHAMSVAQAIALARTLHGPRCAPAVHLVGVAIARPCALAPGLSPVVAAAVEEAARAARGIAAR